MSAIPATLLAVGAIIATVLIVRSLAHRADEALTADFGLPKDDVQ